MTRCEICGKTLPDILDPAFTQDGHRAVAAYGRGPYAICREHSTAEVLLWMAETLFCDQDFAKTLRARLATDRQACYKFDGLRVRVTLPEKEHSPAFNAAVWGTLEVGRRSP